MADPGVERVSSVGLAEIGRGRITIGQRRVTEIYEGMAERCSAAPAES